MKIQQFVEDNIANLEHFIEQGGWPIRSRQQEIAPLLKYLPKAFTMKDGLLSCNVKKIPAKVLAAFWKFKFEEARRDGNKLYNAIEEAHRKANS